MRIRHILPARKPGDGVRHHEFESPDGFWLPVLCKTCNNAVTGSRYGEAYADFVTKFGASGRLTHSDGRALVLLRNIYPLRVAKQMVAMFLSAQPSATPS